MLFPSARRGREEGTQKGRQHVPGGYGSQARRPSGWRCEKKMKKFIAGVLVGTVLGALCTCIIPVKWSGSAPKPIELALPDEPFATEDLLADFLNEQDFEIGFFTNHPKPFSLHYAGTYQFAGKGGNLLWTRPPKHYSMMGWALYVTKPSGEHIVLCVWGEWFPERFSQSF